jgi:uncharacterized protein YndB with AHSA1/START domain
MPTVRRSRTLPVPPAEVWATVGDPHHLPRWWPRVARVEQVDAGGFTEVLHTDRGKAVRADFRLTTLDEGERIGWSQEVEGTPFERVLAAADTTIRVLPADGGAATRVELELRQKLNGFARFGGFMVRGATRRSVDEALDGLERLFGAAG